MQQDELIQKLGEANKTFTPGASINSRDLFSGRLEQVTSVITAVTRPGQHAIMYGERGVGKTSLANVMHAFLPQEDNFYTIKINCSTNQSFTDIWRGIFREMQLRSVAKGLTPTVDEVNAVITHLIDESKKITPNDVRFVLSQLPSNVLIIIDEFDRIQEAETIAGMADTIKALSDYSLPITLVLVAVGDNIDKLIKDHPSIARALVQVKMPRMSEGELQAIVDRGMERLKMTVPNEVKSTIVELSQGLPHYTHLLALEAVTSAINAGRSAVTKEDLDRAIKTAIDKTRESTTRAYHKAVVSPRSKKYPIILLGCALAKTTDIREYFSPAEIGRALKAFTGENYDINLGRFTRHLREFASEKKGSVLTEIGTKGQYRYRFTDPMMQPFLIMKGIADGKIPAHLLKKNESLT